MEKRLQKRIIVKARGSFALEDFELRSPTQKTPLDRSDADREGDRADRRRRRRKKLGPPAEVEAMLEEEERSNAADREVIGGESAPETRDDGREEERRGADAEAAAGNSALDHSPSGAAPDSPSSLPSSETPQVASETHAVPVGSNDTKPRG
jgi:hypothetical protein